MKVNFSTTGANKMLERIQKRSKFFKGDAIRPILQAMGKDAVARWERKLMSFTPGPVRDLKPAYKKQKARSVGNIYPILMATGALWASVKSRVTKGPWTVTVWHAGKHYSGMAAQDLADIHEQKGRSYMKLSDKWTEMWKRRIMKAFWATK